MKIFVSGGSGMVGRNLVSYLRKNSQVEIFAPNSQELNLLDYSKTESFIKRIKPDAVIHCAGLVGGIQTNIEKPYSFLFIK